MPLDVPPSLRGARLDDADVLIGATTRVLGIGVATGNMRHYSGAGSAGAG